jgi:hypothetical protein
VQNNGLSGCRAQESGKLYLHNHLRFTILYHRDAETDLSRIVGFEVEPFSVKHKYDGKWNPDRPELKTCNSNSMKFVSEKDAKQEVKEGEEIVFTYDVTFKVRLHLCVTLHVSNMAFILLHLQAVNKQLTALQTC